MRGDLAVGQEYPWGIPRFAHASAAVFSFGETENTLALYYRGPTSRELEDIRDGDASFALLFEGSVIFLLYRFGGQPWNEAPYSTWHTGFAPEADPYASATDGRGSAKVALETHLVDTLTGLLMARRGFALQEEFVLHLEEFVDEQVAAGPTTREDFEAAVAGVHHCDPEDLVARARCLTVFRRKGRS